MTDSWDTYLRPGERILWEGAPLAGIRNPARLLFLSIFGIPFLLVGLVGTAVGLRHVFWMGETLPGLFSLAIGGILLLIGYALVFEQWAEAARAHRNLRYALTTRCALVARQSRVRSLQTYPILPDTALELEHGDGYDNVWFHVRVERDTDGDRTTSRIGFEGIRNGTEVYQMMRSIQTGQT
jgi:hypothetical protein